MLFAKIDILDEQFDHHRGWYVGVRDGRIAYIGPEAPAEDFGEVYDGSGKLLMTAFFNCHSHSAMTLMRGYGENLALSDWLNTRIFPFEAQLDSDAIYYGTLLAAAEMVRFGIVSTTDMYYNSDAICRAVLESGIKMNLGLPITCFDERTARELPIYAEHQAAVSKYHGAGGGRLAMDLSIHGEYTSTPKAVADMAQLARGSGLRMHLHLSETKSEHEACKQRHGKTPARYFYDLGVFDTPTTAAHCVWVEEDDMALLREKNVTVASCPVSNLKLASGFCSAPQLLQAGVNVALGTDSVASNNNLNILEEVKLFATLFKATSGDPTAITPRQALYAATRAGALAQGREDCGALRLGNRADLIVLDIGDKPHLFPCYDMATHVVFSALGSDICMTMADGQVLYRDGQYPTMDLPGIRAGVDAAIRRILAKLG